MTFLAYKVLQNHITTNHEKDTEILFYKIKSDTSDLLTQLLYERNIKKNSLLKKHKEVQKYLEGKNQINIDLSEINAFINKGLKNNPYNIYITNKNLVVKNTTYSQDMNFDLSFAKKSFDKRWKSKVLKASVPYFKKTYKKFFSYSDSYFVLDGKKDGILQLSYTYSDISNKYNKIQKMINTYPNVKSAFAYVQSESGFMNKVVFTSFKAFQYTLNEMLEDIKSGTKIKNSLSDDDYKEEIIIIEGRRYKSIYMATSSFMFNNNKMFYSLLLDESKYEKDIRNLNYSMLLVFILGLLAIFIITKIRNKETRLKEQDKFVQSSMHEIRTPLSVITLNNDLRCLEFGEDEYTNEIDSSLKILLNSYDDMSFILTHEKLEYKIETLNLEELVRSRALYFKTIAKASDKNIEIDLNSNINIKISLIELTRLIDNNLSNAIKYSSRNSIIRINLKNNSLTFNNQGVSIKDTNKIFKKYFRENSVIGGYGIGLNIVKNISKKYNIKINLESNDKTGTSFKYVFNTYEEGVS